MKCALAWTLSFVTTKEVIPYRGAGKILDIGCGGGYLYRLKQWVGILTASSRATGVKQARSLGVDVAHGMVEDGHFESDFFDVIRLSNVVDHLARPKETFREIRRILKPEGIVYLTVPNTRSLVFWLFRQTWYALVAPRHVISYSPRTLKALADATGFEVARQKN
jgi:2-polyprenyl-3-methyl-5-hydroxy-6-metoxy-1,4-benzoquinol methylase